MMSSPRPPNRLKIVHIRSGNSITTQFNPVQVEMSLGISWNRLSIPGRSHQEMQYAFTENLKTNFDLGFDSQSARDLEATGPMISAGPADRIRPEIAIRFFLANHYVEESGETIALKAPSDLLLVWPGFFSLIAKPLTAKLSFSMWERLSGKPRIFVIGLAFESDAKKQIRYDDVLRRGLIRHTETSSP